MRTDEDQAAMERSAGRAGVVVLLLVGAHAAVLAWGRSPRDTAVAAAVTCVVTVAYVHVVWARAGRPIRWGSFQGLSFADFYRVSDAIARGEAVAERRLARPALGYVEQLRKSARITLVGGPLFVASVLVRWATGHHTGRRLASDVLTAVIVAVVSVRWASRMPKVLQAERRTRALHPSA